MIPEIILGPPGTGKTETLLGIVEQELAGGVHPSRIGLVTFTRRGARVAIERAAKKFSLQENELRYFRTLHSLCFQSLGVTNGDVLEGKKMVEFGDWIGMEVSEHRSFDEGNTYGFTKGDRALFMENLSRVRCVPLREQYDLNDDGLDWPFVERTSRALAEFKKSRHLLDYTDMLAQFVANGWSPDIEVLLVDETQDLSMLQWHVVWLLAKNARRVVFAGDDDQAIYKWAGAAIDYFIALEGRVTVLDQSWRVPGLVQDVSSEIIKRVSHRRPKIWDPRRDEKSREIVDGKVNRHQRIYDVDYSGKDILVLGRNAYVLRGVMRMLEQDGIVYEWRGHSSVRQSLLEAIQTWERLRKGEEVGVDEVSKVYEYMSSGKGVRRGYKTLPGFDVDEQVSLNVLKMKGGLMREDIWHDALDRIPMDEKMYLLRARRSGESLVRKPRVRVSTIHGAKGDQADHVVLIRDMASRTYKEMIADPEDEHRVWYVGATRARQELSIVAPQSNQSYNV